jgi:hypothetical protein
MNILSSFIFIIISFLIYPILISGQNSEHNIKVIVSFISSIFFSPIVLILGMIGLVVFNVFTFFLR